MRNCIIAMMSGVALCAAQASAQIVYESQTRSVWGIGGIATAGADDTIVDIGTTPSFAGTSELGRWEGFVHWGQKAIRPDGFVSGEFETQAYQLSNLADDRITASGWVSNSIGGNQGGGRGVSQVLVTFTLAEDTAYTLDMSMANNNYGDITLVGPGINVVWQPLLDEVINRDLSQSGVLTAGEYRLVIDPIGEGGFPDASYNFSLVVPAPASAGLLGLGGLVAMRRRR